MAKNIINQRIVQVLNFLLEEGIVEKKSTIAEKLDCSPQTITEILGGRQGAKLNLLQKIFEEFDVSYEFIFEGRKPILNKMKTFSLKGSVEEQESQQTVPVPMVDISVAAGNGFHNPEYLDEMEQIYLPTHLAKKDKTYLCVRIKGASMTPTLQDGGYLIVRMLERYEWEQIRDGEVYILSDKEGKAFVKRIRNRLKQQGDLLCISDNPDKVTYPTFNMREEDIHTIWYAEWYFTRQMPDIHESYYNKVSELEDHYQELRSEFQELKSKLIPVGK